METVNEGNCVTIEFVEDYTPKWRAADLLPREGCTIGHETYIKLGLHTTSDVSLHVVDPESMASGQEGSYRKKHFFFHVQSASVVALVGDTLVVPRRINVQIFEKITFTPEKTVPYNQENTIPPN